MLHIEHAITHFTSISIPHKVNEHASGSDLVQPVVNGTV